MVPERSSLSKRGRRAVGARREVGVEMLTYVFQKLTFQTVVIVKKN